MRRDKFEDVDVEDEGECDALCHEAEQEGFFLLCLIIQIFISELKKSLSHYTLTAHTVMRVQSHGEPEFA